MVTPGIQTFRLGVDRHHYFIELDEYQGSGQPKLLLVRYATVAPKLLLTYESKTIDLRAYDADFNFRRRHALIRMSGRYAQLYNSLINIGVLNPTPDTVSDGMVSGRVCQIDLTYCIITPTEDAIHGTPD